jgi:hypothetical protein
MIVPDSAIQTMRRIMFQMKPYLIEHAHLLLLHDLLTYVPSNDQDSDPLHLYFTRSLQQGWSIGPFEIWYNVLTDTTTRLSTYTSHHIPRKDFAAPRRLRNLYP